MSKEGKTGGREGMKKKFVVIDVPGVTRDITPELMDEYNKIRKKVVGFFGPPIGWKELGLSLPYVEDFHCREIGVTTLLLSRKYYENIIQGYKYHCMVVDYVRRHLEDWNSFFRPSSLNKKKDLFLYCDVLRLAEHER